MVLLHNPIQKSLIILYKHAYDKIRFFLLTQRSFLKRFLDGLDEL